MLSDPSELLDGGIVLISSGKARDEAPPATDGRPGRGRLAGPTRLFEEIPMVGGFRGGVATVPWLVQEVIKKRPIVVQLLQRAHLTNAHLTGFFGPYVASVKTFYQAPLFDAVVEHLTFPMPDYLHNGIRVRILSVTADFPPGLDVSLVQPGPCSINTKWMSIVVKVVVCCPAPEVGEWDIGFIQTVTRLDRKYIWTKTNGDQMILTSRINGAHKDGPNGYADAWFDPGCKTTLSSNFNQFDVEIRDRPGTSWTADGVYTLTDLRGGEAFKTWLALRKKDGTQTRCLRRWEWHDDWTIDPHSVPRYGIQYDGIQTNATGEDAVLNGVSAKDAFQDEVRDVKNHIISFDDIRKMRVTNTI
jgi:hypothetical protein